MFHKNKTQIRVDGDGNKVSVEIESNARKFIPMVRIISGTLALFLIFSTIPLEFVQNIGEIENLGKKYEKIDTGHKT